MTLQMLVGNPSTGRIVASPRARRDWLQLTGRPLPDISGSGPSGRIIAADVYRYVLNESVAPIIPPPLVEKSGDLPPAGPLVSRLTARASLADLGLLLARWQGRYSNLADRIQVTDFLWLVWGRALSNHPNTGVLPEYGRALNLQDVVALRAARASKVTTHPASSCLLVAASPNLVGLSPSLEPGMITALGVVGTQGTHVTLTLAFDTHLVPLSKAEELLLFVVGAIEDPLLLLIH